MEVFLSLLVGVSIGLELSILATVLHEDYNEKGDDE